MCDPLCDLTDGPHSPNINKGLKTAFLPVSLQRLNDICWPFPEHDNKAVKCVERLGLLPEESPPSAAFIGSHSDECHVQATRPYRPMPFGRIQPSVTYRYSTLVVTFPRYHSLKSMTSVSTGLTSRPVPMKPPNAAPCSAYAWSRNSWGKMNSSEACSESSFDGF